MTKQIDKTAAVNSQQVTSQPAAKPAGIRRVTSKAACNSLVSAFTMPISLTAGKAVQQAAAVTSSLKPATIDLTSFGHKALTSNVRALTAVIDSWLIAAAVTGSVDVRQLIDDSFNVITTTSRVSGEPAAKQVIATYNKVIDHLNCFVLDSSYSRYLSKRLAAAGYTPASSKAIFDGFKLLASVTKSACADGRQAAKKHYKIGQ